MDWKHNFVRTAQWLRILPLVVLLAAFASCNNTTDSDQKNYRIVWQDEFNGALNQMIDSTRWNYDIGTDWGNAQQEYDTRRPENVSMDGAGNLAIVARKESFQGRNYTSARITTKGKVERKYGKFEARIRMPWGQGIWPAFWMLGANVDSVIWPQCGEIDIMEFRGQQPSTIYGSLHGPTYSGVNNIGGRFNLVNDRFDNDFHVFTVEWDASSIKWYVDGSLYHTVTPKETNNNWVFDHPFFIILNLAVGGYYVGSPSSATVFPQTMLIDYVRVYEEVR